MRPSVRRGSGNGLVRADGRNGLQGPGRQTPPGEGGDGGDGRLPSEPQRGVQRRPWDLFLMVAAALLLVSQARIHSFIPGISAFRPALLLAIVGLGLWVIQTERIRSIKCFKDPVSRTLIFLSAWAVVTVPFALWPGGAARYLLSGLLPTLTVFLIVVAAVRNLEDVRRLVATFAFGAGFYALMAPAGGAVRGMRAGGYDPNDAAMFIVSGIPVLIFFVLFGRHRLTRVAAALGTMMCLFGVVDTGSRGGFLALVVMMAFMILMLRGVSPALRVGVVALGFLAMIPVASTDYWERMETITEFDDGYGEHSEIGGRRNVWSRGVEHWMANPVTGVGIGQYSFAEGGHPAIRSRIEAGRGTVYRSAHSQWVMVLAELGAVGIVAFVLLFGFSFRQLRRIQVFRWRPGSPFRHREVEVLAGVLMASLVGLAVGGSLLSNAYSGMLWGVFAVVAGLLKVFSAKRQRRRARADEAELTPRLRRPTAAQHKYARRVS